MEFACFTAWDQLPDSADALFAAAEQESIFFSRPWLEDLVSSALERGQSVLLACVVDSDRVLAILPLMKGDSGEHLHSLDHLYTALYTLLLADGDQPIILKCLVAGFLTLPAYSLRLETVDENDRNVRKLQQALESSEFICHRHFRFYNWIHRLQEQSFDDYMAARPPRVRNTITRKMRKLEREHGYTVRLYTTDNLENGIADYRTVYRASWKANELFEELIERLAFNFASRGWLRLAVLYIEKKPAAAQLWFVAHGKASIFKLVYHEDWKRYSPGSILTRYLVKHVIENDKVAEIDFLIGNDAYKQDWMSERRQRWRLCCARHRSHADRATRIFSPFKAWLTRP